MAVRKAMPKAFGLHVLKALPDAVESAMVAEQARLNDDATQRMTMPPSLSVSIIISTCNRSSALRHTLNTLENVRLAADRQVQLILVDNGSIDDTASVVR